MEVALDAGAEDVELVEGYFEVTCDPKIFETVRKALEDHKIPTETAETSYIPTNYVDLDVESGKKMLKLKDILDENDDVQNVYANDNIPEDAWLLERRVTRWRIASVADRRKRRR